MKKYEVLSNLIEAENNYPTKDNETVFDFEVTFRYNGDSPIVNDWTWSIYFYMDQTILRGEDTHVTQPVSIGAGLDVSHVDGYLWRFTVNKEWTTMQPGDVKTWKLRGDAWIVSDSTLFPNWYFACEGEPTCDPAVIQSTVGLTYNKPGMARYIYSHSICIPAYVFHAA